MTDQLHTGSESGCRRIWPDFTEKDIDDLIEELPGGHSVSPAMRRLLEHLLDVRRRRPHLIPGQTVSRHDSPSDDVLYAPAQPVRPLPRRNPRRGLIVRKEDVSGISGVGVIGEFMEASDGAVAYRWLGGPPQNQPKWEFYDKKTTAPFEQISGHTGRTELIWIDGEEVPET